MPNFLRKWFLKKELKFWKYQMESLATDIEYGNGSDLIKANLHNTYLEYEKVYKMMEALLLNNI